MFQSLALISVLTSAAWAQSTATSYATSSSANPLIPTDISTPCTTFLNSLDTDSSLGTCLSTLKNTTSAFAPGSSATPSSSDVTSTLTNLCSDSLTSTCPESLVRQKITDFYAACPAELATSPKSDVVRIYDILYAILPLRTSVCSKDDSGNWCVKGASATTRELKEDADESSVGFSELLALLYITDDRAALRRRDQQPAIVPNMTTYRDTNLLFNFFTPDLNASQLCVTCARQVLTAYINFESNVPYAPGLNASLLLSTQSALFSAVQSKCPANFLGGAVQAAGGLSGGAKSSAIPTYGTEYQRTIAMVMGALALVFSVAL